MKFMVLFILLIICPGMAFADTAKVPGKVGTEMPSTMGVGTPVDGPNKPEVGAVINAENVGIGTENPLDLEEEENIDVNVNQQRG